jgi:hypothetical protein
VKTPTSFSAVLRTRTALLPLAGCLLLVAGPARAQETPSRRPPAPTAVASLQMLDARYTAARDAYAVRLYQPAFAEFAALADAGHCGAARRALHMPRCGKALHATEFRVPLDRVRQWQHLPTCATAALR